MQDCFLGKVSLRGLILMAIKAIYKPQRVFKEIGSSERIKYSSVLIFMSLAGAFFIFFHLRFVVGKWLWDFYYEFFILIAYMLVSIGVWILGSVGLYFLGRCLNQKVNFLVLEKASFCLWFLWVSMPLFDFPHLFGFKTVFLVRLSPFYNDYNFHFSWLIVFPIIFIELRFILKDILKVNSHLSWILAGFILILARLVAEPTVAFCQWLLAKSGYRFNYYLVQFYIFSLATIILIFLRRWISGFPLRRILFEGTGVLALFTGASFLILRISFMKNINGAPPLPFELKPVVIARPRIKVSLEERFLEISSQEKEVFVLGPYYDGIPHRQVKIYRINLAKKYMEKEISSIRVTLKVSSKDGLGADLYPAFRVSLISGDSQAVELKSYLYQDLKGAEIYNISWDNFSGKKAEFLKQLKRTREMIFKIIVEVHSGGDYSDSDLVKVYPPVLRVYFLSKI